MKNIISSLSKNERWFNYQKFISTRKQKSDSLDFVLCDISPQNYKPFYFGINIIDKIVNNSEYNCGRAIWQSNEESMEWKTQLPIRNFNVIGIGLYMYYQLFAIPAFLANNKIQPLSKNRTDNDPIIILGGQGYYFTNGYNKFVDIACIGDGEEWILEVLKICKEHKGNRKKILLEAAEIEGSYVPEIHDKDDSIIKKRILPKEKLKNSLLTNKDILSKTRRAVIEIARGCKYNCGFCALSKRMYPFRENKFEDLQKTVSSFPVKTHIYPFAPDEASYKEHEKLEDFCNFKDYNYFRYNFRLNTIQKIDIIKKNVSNQIVLGIDGISQRIIDITDKKIKLDYLLTDIAPLIFKQNYALLKLNYVFNYDFETQDDYNELELFWRSLIELRIKSGNKTMIQIAPTPFVPEYFIPLQYFKIKNHIDSRFEDIYNNIKHDYFENKKIIPLFKVEGLQGYKNYFVSIIIHRLENLSEFVYFCYKNGYRSSKYSEKLFNLLNDYLKLKGIKSESLLAELNTNEKYYFNKIDWSGGNLDYIGIVANRAEKMKKLAYS